jgi:hypothetical protein
MRFPARVKMKIRLDNLLRPAQSEFVPFMRYLFVMPFVWLAAVASANGALPEVSVTSTNLDLPDYTFTITTNAAEGGIAFHVIITAKTHNIPTNSSVNLEVVGDEEFSADIGNPPMMWRAAPPVRVSLKKSKRIWQADFIVPRQQLTYPGLFCLFAEGYDGETGGVIDAKTVTFYEIKIQDFVSPRAVVTSPAAPITPKDLLAMWQHDTNWISWMPTNWAAWYRADPNRMAQLAINSISHCYYMGTGNRSGYDYVAIVGGPHTFGKGSYQRVTVRGGELPIESRHPVTDFATDDFSEMTGHTNNWQEIDMSKL